MTHRAAELLLAGVRPLVARQLVRTREAALAALPVANKRLLTCHQSFVHYLSLTFNLVTVILFHRIVCNSNLQANDKSAIITEFNLLIEFK